MALDPRIRDSAGQFSAKGTLTARALRKAWMISGGRGLRQAVKPVISGAGLSMFHRAGIRLEFDAVPSSFTADKIDDINAVIRGVSVITSGLTARGHDLEVDNVTIAQMQKCGEERGQVPVKVDHKSGAAAVCGFLTNFRQEENKLKADWFLLDSHPQKLQILEVARRMPRGVGLSASFVSPEKGEKTKNGKAAARCQELISVDYVTLPAANPDGMFSAQVDSTQTTMNEEILAAIEAAITKAIGPLSAQVTALQKQSDLAQNPPTLEEVANMSEAELAEIGLTPADVQEALEQAAAEEQESEDNPDGEYEDNPENDGQDNGEEEGEMAGAGAGEGEGEGEGEAAGVGAGAASTGFAALARQLTELSAELKAIKGQRVADTENTLLSAIEDKVEMLSEENGRLMQAIQAGGQPSSPGVDRNNIRFFSAGKQTGEFENLVQLCVDEKSITKGQAFSVVIKENPSAYQDYLVRLGVTKAAE